MFKFCQKGVAGTSTLYPFIDQHLKTGNVLSSQTGLSGNAMFYSQPMLEPEAAQGLAGISRRSEIY